MIVPFAPGGGSDIVGRILAVGLTEAWGQSVVVDNRPGAGSTLGTALAAKAPPDGYTLLVASSALALSPALYRDLPFDTLKDFAPVALLANQPSIVAVHPAVAAKSVGELVALAKAQPGKLAYASAGAGSATHLGSELLKLAAGIDLAHIPYKSAGQAASALVGGEVQVLVTNMATALPLARAGRIRGLAVTSPKRSSLAPELPTVAESGLAGFEYATWYGMLVPARTPAALVARLNQDSARALQSGPIRERLVAQGLDVIAGPADAFGTYLAAELARWARVAKVAQLAAN